MTDILATMAGSILVVGGRLVGLLQAAARLQRRPRPLTASEEEMLRGVYGDSVALDRVRIVEGKAGVFSMANDRPFTLGDTIYLKTSTSPGVLIHECAHVWQHQHEGRGYAFKALWAQFRLPDAYAWREELARGKTLWAEFNKEAQAQFLQDVFNGVDTTTAFARETLAYVRSAPPPRS